MVEEAASPPTHGHSATAGRLSKATSPQWAPGDTEAQGGKDPRSPGESEAKVGEDLRFQTPSLKFLNKVTVSSEVSHEG